MIGNRWARKGLQHGDLTALSELSDSARWNDPNPSRVERLTHRGFVAKRADNKLHVTVKGRAALLLGGHVRNFLG
jgi:hypothetical protein